MFNGLPPRKASKRNGSINIPFIGKLKSLHVIDKEGSTVSTYPYPQNVENILLVVVYPIAFNPNIKKWIQAHSKLISGMMQSRSWEYLKNDSDADPWLYWSCWGK